MFFTQEIQPACLPDNLNYPVLNSPGAIAGWGLTNAFIRNVSKNLQNAKVKLADGTFNEDCYRTQLALIENSIMCLGFILFLKLIFLIDKENFLQTVYFTTRHLGVFTTI